MLREMGSIIAYESDVFTFFHFYLWKLKKKTNFKCFLVEFSPVNFNLLAGMLQP